MKREYAIEVKRTGTLSAPLFIIGNFKEKIPNTNIILDTAKQHFSNLFEEVTVEVAHSTWVIVHSKGKQVADLIWSWIPVYLAEDSNTMPETLTAENGAKALLIGEFFEVIQSENEDSGESGLNDEEFLSRKVPISWTNIKSIYKKIRTHFIK